MKANNKALLLVEKGLSAKTVSKLTERQIDVLFSKILNEQVTEVPAAKSYKIGPRGGTLPPNPKGYAVRQDPTTREVKATAMEIEMIEQSDTEISSLDKSAGGTTQDPVQVMGPDGMGDDSDKTIDKEKEITEKKSNPWAICTAQMGKEFGTSERSEWTKPQMKKYERCVKDVKKSLKEQKENLSLFVENKIMDLIEKYVPPKMTKGDLLKYLAENSPEVAPDKPKTKPSEKPKNPPKPGHPLKNPNPEVKPSPKAKKKDMKEGPATAPSKPKVDPKPGRPTEKPSKPSKPAHPLRNPNPEVKPGPKANAKEAKKSVIDTIMKILQK